MIPTQALQTAGVPQSRHPEALASLATAKERAKGLLWHFRNDVKDAGPLIAVGLLYLFVVANNVKVIRKRNAINKGK